MMWISLELVAVTAFYMLLGNTISRAAAWCMWGSGLQAVVFSPLTKDLMPLCAALGVETLVLATVLWLTGHRRYARKHGFWKSANALRWWNRLTFKTRPRPARAQAPNPYVWPAAPAAQWQPQMPVQYVPAPRQHPQQGWAKPIGPVRTPYRGR